MMPDELVLDRPDDWHVHLRDGDGLRDLVPHTARVFGRAIELFEGDAGAARRWLSSPQTVLGGAVPWDLARTEIGSREVDSAIGRIEHGVFS